MSYYPHSENDKFDALFIQTETGDAGRGNYRVQHLPGGSYCVEGQDTQLRNLTELAAYIASIGQAVEVAPFLTEVAAPSLGLVIAETGVSCLGPFQQILGPNQCYQGFRLNRQDSLAGFTSEVAGFMRQIHSRLLELGLEIGRFQQAQKYIGYSSIDMLIYRDPNGRLQATLSEENVRYTGTCPLQAVVYGHPGLQQEFLDGALSMMHHENLPLGPKTVAAIQGKATLVANRLEAAGVPLVGHDQLEGAVIISRPYTSGTNPHLSLAIVASTDELREALFAAAKHALAS
jgi:hypothetical protein